MKLSPTTLPATNIFLDILHAFLMECRAFDAVSFLRQIVVKEAECVFSKKDDCYQVADSHEGHCEVGKIPYQFQAGNGTEIDHTPDKDSIYVDNPFLLRDELDVCFSIVVITKDTTIGKEQNCYGYEQSADASNLAIKGYLGELYSVKLSRGISSTKKYDECCTRTYNEGVGENTERLNKTLLGRMRHMRSRSGVRSRSHTGFVAEKSSLYSLHQRRTYTTSDCLFDAKGIAHNQTYDIRKFCDVARNNKQGQDDISQCHYRHDDTADTGYPMYAAEYDYDGEQRYSHTHEFGRDIKRRIECGTYRIALNRIESKAESNRYQHGKNHSHPSFLQSFLHIICRSADIGVLAPCLEQLGQSGLDKCTAGSEQGDNPHPEYSTRTAYSYCSGHTGKVSRAHPACQRNGKCLKRRNMLLVAVDFNGRVAKQSYHLANHAKLHKPRLDTEPHGTAQEHGNQDVSPQNIIRFVYYIGNCIHLSYYYLFFVL